MSTRAARIPLQKRRAAIRRRRRLTVAILLAAAVGIGLASIGPDAVRQITLPLKHDDIIRQQARDKDLDASLIAAVILEESKFQDQTSHAGARGLMQITPATADFIAHKSGGTAFKQGDLGTPQVNIAYGSWYLRYLLQRYEGDERAAVAAYNAGEGNVDKWIRASGGKLDQEAIRFPETRAYVAGVLTHRQDYRDNYAKELGLDR